MESDRLLSHYRLIEKIGEGGMGVVWSAVDTDLDRQVAIKILPPEVADVPDRLTRFDREARLLASLNHPRIAAIHGREDADGVRFLVLELVPGRSLDEMVADGPLPVAEALDFACQIADALEAAHEAGIIHRDLKPANVKITPDGQVKVLDFGLAKATDVETDGSTPLLSHSPTLTSGGTGAGVILGTASYMSPEQARGRKVDRRTDIWAFGCVLYETLTGKRPFAGETVTDTLAGILEREPDWNVLPERTPPRIRELLRRCLEKDARRRLRDIGDARIELEESLARREMSGVGLSPVADGITPARGRGGLLAAAGFVVGVLVMLGAWAMTGRDAGDTATTDPVRRLSIALPEKLETGESFNLSEYLLSPDGETVVLKGYALAEGERARQRLWARRLDQFDMVPLPESDDVEDFTVSPDSRWVAYASTRRDRSVLLKQRLDGGPPVRIWEDADTDVDRVTWCDENTLIVDVNDGGPTRGLARVDVGSGRREVILRPEDQHLGSISGLTSLPGCRGVVLTTWASDEKGFVRSVSLFDTEAQELRLLASDARFGHWLPGDVIVFSRRDALLALPLGPDLKPVGSVQPVLAGLYSPRSWDSARFAAGRDGTLLYRPGGTASGRRNILQIDDRGETEPLPIESRDFDGDLAISPDGSRLAVVIAESSALYQVWTYDLRRGTSRPVPVDRGDRTVPLWSPDGRHLIFASFITGTRDQLHLWELSGGEPQVLLEADAVNESLRATSWSANGRFVLGHRQQEIAGKTVSRSFVIDLEGDRQARPLLDDRTESSYPVLSPAGDRVAYIHRLEDRREVHVQTFPPDGNVLRVPVPAPLYLSWSADGRFLRVEDVRGRLLEVELEDPRANPRLLAAAVPLDAASVDDTGRTFAPLPSDGFAFVQRSPDEREVPRLDVILNWASELPERLRSR